MNKLISIVIPVFNEEASLSELIERIKDTSQENKLNTEIIFINDGSTDATLEEIKKFSQNNSNIHIISFRKNLGKAVALNEGFSRAQGKYIVTLDGDLQDGPENIPMMLKKLEEGVDLVVGWKKKRQDPLGKTIPSKAFNFFVRTFSHVPLHDFNSGLKLMRAEVAKELFLYGELHRFIPVLAYHRGFKVTEVAVNHHPRKYGSSKYGWQRLFKGFFDFLTVMFLGSFKERPLHFFGTLGITCILIGVIIGSYLSVLHFQGVSIGRRPLLNLAVLLVIAGLQVFLSGLIAEMIVNNQSKSTKNLPIDYED